VAGARSFREQLQRNLVAIISVFIAVSSLSYNTWRNEKTEYNRNQRNASFEVLLKLGELQELVFYSHYEKDGENRGNPRSGWAIVLTIRDLSAVLADPLPAAAANLVAVWENHWAGLGVRQASADAVLASIEDVREETLTLLGSLD
jgi:hypothetical protein